MSERFVENISSKDLTWESKSHTKLVTSDMVAWSLKLLEYHCFILNVSANMSALCTDVEKHLEFRFNVGMLESFFLIN